MNVLEQVEKLIDNQRQHPDWAREILFELREIKRLLEEMKRNRSDYTSGKMREKHAYFAFVNRLRKELRADLQNDRFPEIHYQGRELGINFKGYIYDKATAEEWERAWVDFTYDLRKLVEKYEKRVRL